MGIPGDEVVRIGHADATGDSTVITVSFPDKTGHNCDLQGPAASTSSSKTWARTGGRANDPCLIHKSITLHILFLWIDVKNARSTTTTTSTPTSSPNGSMTRARAKLLQAKVNSLLSLCDFDTPLDGLLLHTHTLCIIRYEEKDLRNGGEATSRCQTPAVLPVEPAGTTAPSGPTGPSYRTLQEAPLHAPDASGTTGPATGTTGQRYYRPLLPLATDASDRSSRSSSGTTALEAVLPVATDTTGCRTCTTGPD